MTKSWQSLEAKVAAFDAIYSLDCEDESPDDGLRHSMSMIKRRRNDVSQDSAESKLKTRKLDNKAPQLNRTISAPVTIETKGKPDSTKVLRRAATIQASSAIPDKESVSNEPLAGLFNGLHFYFIPNNDRHPGRRTRIQLAVKRGATWETEFNDTVTHVVVDRELNYEQVKRLLKQIPPHIHIEHEHYTSDCYVYRAVVDPGQSRYHIKGYQPDNPKKAVDRESSLQLKPAKRDVQTHEPETPSQRTSESITTDPSPIKQVSDAYPSHGGKGPDALESAISEVLKVQDLPIDDDDEHEVDQVEESILTIETVPQWQKNFQCMQQNTGARTDGPNGHVIAQLQKMADHYAAVQDEWRPMAYRKAINALRKHPVKITTAEEAKKLPHVGLRLALKIEEINRTGFLQRLHEAQTDPLDIALATFMKVYGIGFATGMAFIASGLRTLEDLRTKATLTENQKIGLEHYEDFNTRIPRAEVKAHSDIVNKAAKTLEAGLVIYTMGSYRRGGDTSGDIDLIITHPTWSMRQLREMLIKALVPSLFKQGFLKCSLAATSRSDGSKWHGASCLPGTTMWRRIDFLLVPPEELGAALIYFTGNDIFNRSMRLLASKKSMRLNQRGLYKDVLRGKNREKITEGDLLEGRDERKIFAILGVPWREPEARGP